MFTLRLAMDLFLAIDNMDPSWLAFIISCNRETQVKLNTFNFFNKETDVYNNIYRDTEN